MVKVHTTLINNTDKTLSICEESLSGVQEWIAQLSPNPDPTTTPPTNDVSENGSSIQKGFFPNSYEYTFDRSDSYTEIRVWCDTQSVFGVSRDDLINNSTITIKLKDGEFIKEKSLRKPQNQPAPTSEDAASTSEGGAPIKKKDHSTSSPWGNFINFFRPHKSANTNARK